MNKRSIKNTETDSNKRTNIVLKNVSGLFIVKGLSISTRLVLVPITLNYLDPVKFGVWMTLSSILEMMILLEFGLGNGLRNKLAGCLAKNQVAEGRVYISTSYALLGLILFPTILLLLILNHYADWSVILNAPVSLNHELQELVSWILVLYSLKMLFDIILSISKANHLPLIVGVIELVSDVFILIMMLILVRVSESSLMYLGVSKMAILAAVPLIASAILFKSIYKLQAPSVYLVEFGKSREILSLSWRFLVIQVSSIVIFTTDNIIISQLFGPEKVTPYAIVFQYFNLATIFFAIISAPLWSAYTDAYHKGDISWIRMTIKKMLMIWLAVSLCVVIMAVLSNDIITFWIGKDIGASNWLITLIAVYVIVQSWNRVFSWVLNGIGDVGVAMKTMVLGAVVNIPVSIYFARSLDMGSAGVVLGTIVSILIFSVYGFYKTNKTFCVFKS